ncbi:MAG: tetratricopeptide repeat protein [Cetobacterium sp.]|uniref:tetratricopeptide repeat protein n=1 Tax=unclassified Cetobacterium TaxID=2630983 RepID=UPI00163B7B30|nr:tetratricopeptide repeat protein [Cetobacterium sp. 2A]MBC2855835.1 tetratricopeptide repeat protein [Cetobacterium sp. 2A]
MKKKLISLIFILLTSAVFSDYRPQEIINLESEISREKDRDKVAVLLQRYENIFKGYINSISDNEELIFGLGDQYFRAGKYERAKTIFGKNIDSSRNLFGAATAARFIGDYNVAIDYYTESLDKYPVISEAYLGRGIAYRNIGEYKKAVDDLEKYKSYKKTETVYMGLGDIYIVMGNYGKAKEILEEGRREYPNSTKINEMLTTVFSK